MSAAAQVASNVYRSRAGATDRPRIVAVLAPKGGVGKTTLTMSLLVSARQVGLSVVGVGMDKQCSLEFWAAARDRTRASSRGGSILDVPVTTVALQDWRRLNSLGGADIAVLDTAPGHVEDETAVEGIVALADLVVIPTSASVQDVFHVKRFHRRLGSDKSFFVLNRVNRRTRTYTSARDSLMRSGRLCPVDIPDRDAIGGEFGKGLAIADSRLAGSEFFDGLWNFVAAELGLPKIRDEDGEGDHAA